MAGKEREEKGGIAGRREGGMEEGRGNGKCGGPARFTPKMNI